MGLMADFKGRRALMAHNKGNLEEAQKLYEEAFQEGLNKANILLGYSILLVRGGDYAKAQDVLKRVEKAQGLTPDQRTQMLTYYAVASWKLGRMEYAIKLLKEVYRKGPSGTIYGTLGYLLIEQGDLEEALAFNKEAVEYDDEDTVALDNLGQTYYRLAGDKEEARQWFERALAEKPEAIDTNYFLAQYDIEAGDFAAAREKLETALKGRRSPLNYATQEMIEEALAKLPPQEA